MSNELITISNDSQNFNFNGTNVRIIMINGEPWWVLKEICEILNISNSRDTANRLDKDEVGLTDIIDSMGRNQQTTIINESGLYNVILRSDKPEAKAFKKWITSVVLPSIRKNGFYGTPQLPADPIDQVLLLASKLTETATQVKEERAKNLQLTHQIEEQAPAYEHGKQLLQSVNSITMKAAAGELNVGRTDLFAFCRYMGYLITGDEDTKANHNLPYQKYIKAGWFEIKPVPKEVKCFSFSIDTTFVFQKGIDGVRRAINKYWEEFYPNRKNY